MPTAAIDPAPRSYPPFVSLLRRSARRWEPVDRAAGFEAIEAWLLGDAAAADDTLPCFEQLVWRMVAAGLPLDRASVHVGHAASAGYRLRLELADRRRALRRGQGCRGALQRTATGAARCSASSSSANLRGKTAIPTRWRADPLMAELAEQGIAEYVAMPIRAGGHYHNAMTVATKRDGGFSEEQFATIRRMLKLFALHVERHIALAHRRQRTQHLSRRDGRRPSARGSIKRGAGEPMPRDNLGVGSARLHRPVRNGSASRT